MAFNRTIMELKHLSRWIKQRNNIQSFNRTIMELKQSKWNRVSRSRNCF